ncbi:glycosyltransferase [Photobacterium gaetbulicola]|uniref:Glycosyltransferase n=1 Tax=Photobacterium gaetbulicola TaxID=1295392 RepID=A0A0B9GA99_9GAMM|nr:MJ1255/VC2487 family glycosyltransferase [Photobacterium gaetbulicola]KHT65519.1 glycosyltransferase [Photobacterium gaetbulicola]
MKILYGVQGTGNGHISRAREMARAFSTLGAEVDFLFTGRPDNRYFDMDCFGQYQVRRGLTFVTENGEVNRWKTLANNHITTFLHDVRSLDVSGYDLVLNDFEPVSAWAARRQKVHSIGISHQNAFLCDIPTQGRSWVDAMVLRGFAPTAQQLGVHWFHFNQMILPPIVPLHAAPVGHDQSVLVYLPFENLQAVLELLTRFTQVHFYCYHPDAVEDREYSNVSVRQLNRESFHQRLHQCCGVIANGGFELPSEAMSLGKKLLLKPLHGQYEQLSNVMTLEMMGLARSMSYLDPAAVRNWLDCGSVGAVTVPDVAMGIARWVLSGNWHHCDELWQQLWERVEYPEVVQEAMVEWCTHYPPNHKHSAITTL